MNAASIFLACFIVFFVVTAVVTSWLWAGHRVDDEMDAEYIEQIHKGEK